MLDWVTYYKKKCWTDVLSKKKNGIYRMYYQNPLGYLSRMLDWPFGKKKRKKKKQRKLDWDLMPQYGYSLVYIEQISII